MNSRHPKSVALIIDGQQKAGTQLQAAMLARELVHAGCQVSMLLLEHPADTPLPAIPGVEMISTPVGPLNSPGALKGLLELTNCLRRISPDVVHTFLFKANLVGSLAARLAGVQVVVGSRRSLGYDLTPRRGMLSRLFNRLVDGVAINTSAIIEAARSTEGGPLPVPIVIPNGVDSPTADHISRNGSDLSIGILGNIRPIKGHDVALKAFAMVLREFPTAQLHLMGDREGNPQWNKDIDQLITDLDIADSIHWYAPTTPIAEFFAQLDVLASASHSEGMPNSILEAMAAGLPVVATDVGGTAEVLGPAGIVIPPDNPGALAAAMSTMLRDEPRRQTTGNIGRTLANNTFKPALLAQRHLDWYSWLKETGNTAGPALPWLRPRRTVVLAIDMLDTGGTEQQIIQWAQGLRRLGIPVEIMCLREGGRAAETLAAQNIPVHILHKTSRFDLLFLIRQQLLLLRLRPLTVLALLTTAGIWTVPAARLAAIPRVLFSMRATALTDDPTRTGPIRLLAFTLKFAHKVIGNSEPVLDYCRRKLSVAAERTTILPNAVPGRNLRETPRDVLRLANDLPTDIPLFGIAARLVPIKDHGLFLETCQAMKRLMPEAKAVVIGDGPLQKHLEKTIKSMGLGDSVFLLGHRTDTRELIRALDALVLTSRSEGSPNAVLEALTVGTPVVSVSVGDVTSLVDEQSGIVLPGRDPKKLALALSEVLQRPVRDRTPLPETVKKHDPGLVVRRLRALISGNQNRTLSIDEGVSS